MATARDWMTMPQQPLDIVFVPSAMSHATSLGLGIALAQPERRVIVCNGDGSMLMNLGSLVSIAGSGAANWSVVMFDNGVYEVTGAQPTPATGLSGFRGHRARRGLPLGVRVRRALDEWQQRDRRDFNAPGPVFVVAARRADARNSWSPLARAGGRANGTACARPVARRVPRQAERSGRTTAEIILRMRSTA